MLVISLTEVFVVLIPAMPYASFSKCMIILVNVRIPCKDSI